MCYVENLSEIWPVVIKTATCNLYNISEKDSEVANDMCCNQNEAYNTREDEDVIWDKNKILDTLIDSNIFHICRSDRSLALY